MPGVPYRPAGPGRATMGGMTSLLLPRRTAEPDPPPTAPPRLSPALAGALGGLRAAGAGLALVGAFVVVAWVSVPDSGADTAVALRAAGLGWLLAHHVPLRIGQGVLGLTPLGLTVGAGVLLGVSGRWAARVGGAVDPGPGRTLRRVLVCGGLVASYAAIAGAVAVLSRLPQAAADPLLAAGTATAAALLVGVPAVWAAGPEPGTWQPPWAGWRTSTRGTWAGALAGAATLLGAGAALGAAALAVRLTEGAALAAAVAPGAVSGGLLAVAGALLVPNAVVWAATVPLGTGFAVGEGTAVTPAAVDLGALPAVPLLAALPAPGVLPLPVFGVLVVPVLAGVVTARVVLRRSAGSALPGPARTGLRCAVAGGLAGLLMGGLAALSGGPVGGGRLSAVGPSPWQTALAAGVELALAAGLTGYAARRGVRWHFERRGAPRTSRPDRA